MKIHSMAVARAEIDKLNQEALRHVAKIIQLERFLERIQSALGTAETGEALVEVARNAHRAEQGLAALKRKADTEVLTARQLCELINPK